MDKKIIKKRMKILKKEFGKIILRIYFNIKQSIYSNILNTIKTDKFMVIIGFN